MGMPRKGRKGQGGRGETNRVVRAEQRSLELFRLCDKGQTECNRGLEPDSLRTTIDFSYSLLPDAHVF